MTAQAGGEKEKKHAEQKQSLQGAVNDALTRPVREERRERPRDGQQPYEVSEDALRSVLRGND
jgi:hypothetical protein